MYFILLISFVRYTGPAHAEFGVPLKIERPPNTKLNIQRLPTLCLDFKMK